MPRGAVAQRRFVRGSTTRSGAGGSAGSTVGGIARPWTQGDDSKQALRPLGRYLLGSRLATGALGDVHLAREDSEEARIVLVRTLPPELADDLRFARSLWAEAPAGRRFRHRGAAALFAVEREAGASYVVTEFAPGIPYSELIRRSYLEERPLPHHHVAWLGAEVARVLASAHAVPWFDHAPAPIVHGAVNPRQVIIDWDGTPRLVGLGFGRARHAAEIPLSRLPYAAPELVKSQALTAYADVYGIGVMLHAALTGRVVYRRLNAEQTRQAVLDQNAAPIAPHRLTIDSEVGDLIAALMAARPDARPSDLGRVADVLEAAAGGGPDVHRPAIAAVMATLFGVERDAQARQLEATRRLRVGPALVASYDEVATDFTPAFEHAFPAQASFAGSIPGSEGSSGPPESRPGRVLAPGIRVGRYRIEALEEEWYVVVRARARDPNVGRSVDLEVFDPSQCLDPVGSRSVWAELFRASARCAAQFAHPGLPILLDTGRDTNGQLFAAYLQTGALPLATAMEDERVFSSAETRSILVDVVQALGVLADKGYVHGAVSPRSVGITQEGRAVLLHVRTATPPGRGHPALVGETDCASPEYVRGESIGFGADQFAVGVLGYRLLTGRHPFPVDACLKIGGSGTGGTGGVGGEGGERESVDGEAPREFLGQVRADRGPPSDRVDPWDRVDPFGRVIARGFDPEFPPSGLHRLFAGLTPAAPTDDVWLAQVILRLLRPKPDDRYESWAQLGASLRLDLFAHQEGRRTVERSGAPDKGLAEPGGS